MVIRSEKPSDYAQIARVNYEAFLGWHPDNLYVSEPLMVDHLRHNRRFDPDLSLVAEVDGTIVGHAIFSPFRFIVLGTERMGVVLGPIAVLPASQKRGIGSRLMEEGHRRAKEKGFTLSLLCGHPGYYPRFGYQTHVFSVSGCTLEINDPAYTGQGYGERPVNEGDMPWLADGWLKTHGLDSLAIHPGDGIEAWMNHGQMCRSIIIVKDNQVLGYARYVKTNPLQIKELIVHHGNASALIKYLAWRAYGKAAGTLHAALSPACFSQAADTALSLEDTRSYADAFMIRDLGNNSNLVAEYITGVKDRMLRPGVVSFPLMYDVDDGRVD